MQPIYMSERSKITMLKTLWGHNSFYLIENVILFKNAINKLKFLYAKYIETYL